jgi:aminoglycoside phosphotransferase (APT) family kinase protein
MLLKQIQVKNLSFDDYSKFKEEKWAVEQCDQVGVPVPRIVLLDRIEKDGSQYNICVESKLPGTPLDEQEGISEFQRADLLQQAGGVLSKIHSIPIDGFGQLDENGKGTFASVQEIFTDPYINKEKMLGIARDTFFENPIITRAFEIMESGASSYPSIEPKLIHKDFEPKHLLVENGIISGVIDFEMAEGGDPILDLARWHFFYKDSSYDVEEVIKGYSNKEIFTGDFSKRFNLWRIYTGIGYLAFQFQEKNQALIEFAKAEITSDVDYFNTHLS